MVELQDATTGVPIPGLALSDSDAVKGSYIDKVVSWQHGRAQSLQAFGGREFKLRVAMADASLYSIEFRCFNGSKNT